VIGGIIALLWLFYFLFPYAGTKMDQASDYSRQLEDKVFLTDEEMQNFALKNFSLRKEEENHKVKKLEITNKSFAQLANEMRGFLAILRDWEKKHNKNFLTSHPTMKEISSKEILHSANGFEPKLFTFEDYPITSDVYSDPHYQYAHFNLINLYFQEFIGLNIANENFHYGDEEKPFMLHQGVCAVPSNENTKIVNANVEQYIAQAHPQEQYRDEQLEEMQEIFAERREEIENSPDYSDTERQQALDDLAYEYEQSQSQHLEQDRTQDIDRDHDQGMER